MKINKNENVKKSNGNINGNETADKSQAPGHLDSPNPNPISNLNYEPFDFEIDRVH